MVVSAYVVKAKLYGKKVGEIFFIIRMGTQTISNVVVPKRIPEKRNRRTCFAIGNWII